MRQLHFVDPPSAVDLAGRWAKVGDLLSPSHVQLRAFVLGNQHFGSGVQNSGDFQYFHTLETLCYFKAFLK